MKHYTKIVKHKADRFLALYNEKAEIPLNNFKIKEYDYPGEEPLGFGQRILAVNIGNKLVGENYWDYAIIHELGHNFHDTINPEYSDEIINLYSSSKVSGVILRLLTQSMKKSFWAGNCIDALIEGLAEHFALNIFPEATGYFNPELLSMKKKHERNIHEGIQTPISAGYNFFSKLSLEETIKFIRTPRKIEYYKIT